MMGRFGKECKMIEIYKFDIQNKKMSSFVKTKSTYSFTVVLFDVTFNVYFKCTKLQKNLNNN